MWPRAAVSALTALGAVSTPTPAAAGRRPAARYEVTLTETERFEGVVEAQTFTCRSFGSCFGKARIKVLGETQECFLFATVSDARTSIAFSPRGTGVPGLNHGPANPIEVTLAPDGTGSRDAALAAMLGPENNPDKTYTLLVLPNPFPTPVANIRVTVRRQGAAEQSR